MRLTLGFVAACHLGDGITTGYLLGQANAAPQTFHFTEGNPLLKPCAHDPALLAVCKASYAAGTFAAVLALHDAGNRWLCAIDNSYGHEVLDANA